MAAPIETAHLHEPGVGETYRSAWPGSHAFVSFGLSYHQSCAKHVSSTFAATRVLILASGTLSRETDRVKRLEEALGDKVIFTRHGMRPHTLWSEVLEVTQKGRELNADLIVTLGAGSLTDGAKIVSLAIANNASTFDDLHRLHSGQKGVLPATIPIVCIPTSLSGGEYNARAGGTNDHDDRKYSFTSPIRGPSLVILDPELTTTTPDRWWLSTGVRAIDHCVECLCSLQSTPAADAVAFAALCRLIPGLLRCKANASDTAARLECQKAVIDAMQAVCVYAVAMGASHGIGHQLGPLGVGHGETSCILLPAVCRYNISANRDRQDQVRRVLWEDTNAQECFATAGLNMDADLASLLDVLFRALGMPRSLEDAGINAGDKSVMTKLAETSLHDRYCPTNPIPLTATSQVLEILQMCRREGLKSKELVSS